MSILWQLNNPLYPEACLCSPVHVLDLWAVSTSGCYERGCCECAHTGVYMKTEGIPEIIIMGSYGTLSLAFRTRFLET